MEYQLSGSLSRAPQMARARFYQLAYLVTKFLTNIIRQLVVRHRHAMLWNSFEIFCAMGKKGDKSMKTNARSGNRCVNGISLNYFVRMQLCTSYIASWVLNNRNWNLSAFIFLILLLHFSDNVNNGFLFFSFFI